jgi:hypothetical protein
MANLLLYALAHGCDRGFALQLDLELALGEAVNKCVTGQ